MAKELPPIRYVVPGIIAEGLTLLAGKSKIGKSWLILGTAIAVASGGYALGSLRSIRGTSSTSRWRITSDGSRSASSNFFRTVRHRIVFSSKPPVAGSTRASSTTYGNGSEPSETPE
jgi:hypothetical protein